MVAQKGLKQLMRLLGLLKHHQQPSFLPMDAIFVSIDLEVSSSERVAILKNKEYIPCVKELGISTLDTRNLFAREAPSFQRTRAIQTQQYSAAYASKYFEDCDITDFQECVFAETFRVRQDSLIRIITRSLRVQDTPDDDLRSIVLVGHSIKKDINIIQRLGLDMTGSSFPVVAVVDTHSLSRHVLATDFPSYRFTLWGVLTQLGCPHQSHDLHNAGNDATYTLYAMLLLAVRWSEGREGTAEEVKNRELIRTFANHEINETPRWQPTRRALGAHTTARCYPDLVPAPPSCSARI